MILSHKYKFIFICNGKTGTTSIEKCLAKYQEGEHLDKGISGLYDRTHIPPLLLKKQVGDTIWNNYFKFAFVRNPWDWFVSQYFFNMVMKASHEDFFKSPVYALRKYTYGLLTGKRYLSKNLKTKGTIIREKDILKTYQYLKNFRGLEKMESLFQYNYVYDYEGNNMLDFVGRFENLSSDFREIMNIIGINENLPYLNKTKHTNFKSYYNSKTAKLIEDLYKIDVINFDYKYDYN